MTHTGFISLILFLLSLLFGITFTGCGYGGNGNIQVERREVGSFKTVVIEEGGSGPDFTINGRRLSGFKIKLLKDTVEYVSLEYDENLLHHIKTETVGGRLIIRPKKMLFSRRDINVSVHYVNIERIEASAFADITFGNPYEGKRLQIEMAGACRLKGEVYADVLDMDMAGLAEVDLDGKTRKMKGEFAGSGNYRGFGLITDTCILDISGAADAQTNVLQYLKVDVAGAGNVTYRGNPKVEQEVVGTGEVRRSDKADDNH